MEENMGDLIQMPSVGAFVGVGMRTLQRYFAAHFQICPQDYLKALRDKRGQTKILPMLPFNFLSPSPSIQYEK